MPEKLSEADGKAESWALMATLLTGFTLLFFLSFFNRFSGLRSGDGEYGGGMALLHGYLPYRDYFTAGPPLNTLKSAILLKLFGQALIVSRATGVVERVSMALILCRWLMQLFRPWHALVASLVTIIISAGDLTDPIASYNHDSIFFAMIAGLLASLALEEKPRRNMLALAILSGVSAALSLLTKQTVGLGAVTCLGVAGTILLTKLYGVRRAGLWCVGFVGGCTVPLIAVATWLQKMGALQPSLQMMFVTGPSAKAGNSSDFLIREAGVAILNRWWVLVALIALGLSSSAISRGLKFSHSTISTRSERWMWAMAGMVLIGGGELLAFTKMPVLHNASKQPSITLFLVSRLGLLGEYPLCFVRT